MGSYITVTAQKKQESFEFQKFGIQVTHISQDRWFVDDPDYFLDGITIKPQWFFHLNQLGSWNLNVAIQPQFQSIQHQLINAFFVQQVDYPTDYLEVRERLVQRRTMSFYAFELGFQLEKAVTDSVRFEFMAGLGAGYIDSETERLALGFTFVENLSLGLSKSFERCEIYLGFNLNHISNLDIQLPNSGYDSIGWEIGYRFLPK